MLANSLKRKNPAKPKELIGAIRKSFTDASSVSCLSIMFLMTTESTGFFLLTGLPLVLLAHSIKFLQQALSKGLGLSLGTKGMEPFQRSMDKTIAAGDLSY